MSLLVSGCISFDIAEPTYPELAWISSSIEVDSLRPTLKWEQEFDGPADLILIEGDKTVKFITGIMRGGGMQHDAKVLYIEENILDSSHKVKTELKPNRYHFWAVRKHQDEGKSGEWSNYDTFVFYGIGYAYSFDKFFDFHTPEIKN